MRTLAVVAVACSGCGKSKDPSPTAGSAGSGSGAVAKPSTAFKDLVVTVEDKPIAVERALLKRMPDGRAQLYLGQRGTCEQLMTNVFDGKDAHILADLPNYLLSDGTESFGVGDVYTGPPAASDPQSTARIKFEDKRAVVEVGITSPEAKLVAKGQFVAEMCGEQDAPPAATGGATMTIAGHAFPVRAALKRGDNLELTDLPRDCRSARYIGMRLQRERGTWRLDGKRIPAALTGAAPALKVERIPAEESPGPGLVLMALSGSDQVAAYPIALQGTATVTDCDYKPK